MTDSRQTQSAPTRRTYKRKKGMSKGGKIIIWTVVFLLCFFVPFFIIYFGSTGEEPIVPAEITETTEEITPEARIYKLEQENEQLRSQIRDLEAKLDEISRQNAQLSNAGLGDQLGTALIGDRPADNNGWEELPPEEPEEQPVEEQPEAVAPESTAPVETVPETDPSLYGSNGL